MHIQNVIKQRRILDDGLSGVYKGSDPAANGSVLAQKHAADVLRAQIATASPEMDAANKEYSFWRKTNDVLDNTIRRRTGKTGGLLNMAAAGEAGLHLAAGDVPGAVATFAGLKAMRGLLYSVPGLTGRAALLNKLATTVGMGDIAGTTGLLKREAGPAVAALFSNLFEQHNGGKNSQSK